MWSHSLYAPQGCPIHYLSKKGRTQLAYLDLLSEWCFQGPKANARRMQPDRQERVHSGRPPTCFKEWMDQKELILHSHISPLFQTTHRFPLVVFCDLDQVKHLAEALVGATLIIWTGFSFLKKKLTSRSSNDSHHALSQKPACASGIVSH